MIVFSIFFPPECVCCGVENQQTRGARYFLFHCIFNNTDYMLSPLLLRTMPVSGIVLICVRLRVNSPTDPNPNQRHFMFNYNPLHLQSGHCIKSLNSKSRRGRRRRGRRRRWRLYSLDPPNPCDCSLQPPTPHTHKHTHHMGWLFWARCPPSHPHYYTAANPVSQIPAPWTPLRKSYWCCASLHTL